MNRHDLSALLGSRICHDLVSPVGAISNGLDLLAEIVPAGLEEEMSLIKQSSDRATDLLKFYRIAFGAADGESTIGCSSFRDQASAVVESGKTQWQWSGLDEGDMPRTVARLLAVMVLCARSATQLGGNVIVVRSGGDTLGVAAESDRLSLSEAQSTLMDGGTPAEEVAARDVEFSLLMPWAEEAGLRLQNSRGANGMRIEARRL